jgi:ParB-like chromosome segregation protein Spo0J
MSRSRPDILAARETARPLQRLEAHLAGDSATASGLREVPIAELWLRHQPRKLVPDTVLEALLAADRAQPAALLAELQRLAAEPGSPHAATLQALHELAATIRVHGVLVPIRLARLDDRLVVEEGHRRSLATLIAGLDCVPAVVASSASEMVLAARQFVANDQRADLTALEKAAWLRDLMVKADRELRLRQGWSPEEPSFAALFERGDDEDPDAERPASVVSVPDAPGRSAAPAAPQASNGAATEHDHAGRNGTHQPPEAATAEPQANADGSSAVPDRLQFERHKGEVRAQVLSLTGLSLGRYYQLRQLNRLCPEARDVGAALTERHLRPVVVLPPEAQVLVIRAILAHQVPANKVPALVRALADGGAEALRRALATLGLPSPRGRVAGAHTRLHTVPADWEERLRLVAHELDTIKAPHARATRLAQLAEQTRRLEALAAAYRELLAEHGVEALGPDHLPDDE